MIGLIELATILHISSILLLLYKILSKKRCDSVSLNSLKLYLICFIFRYINPWIFKGTYFSILYKLLIISLYMYLIYLVSIRFEKTYEKGNDRFKIWIKLVISTVLGLVFGPKLRFKFQFIWTLLNSISVWIEAFGIIPQIILLRKSYNTNIIQVDYIFILSLYRFVYVIAWTINYFTSTYVDLNLFLSAIVQSLIFSDFVAVYIYFRINNKDFTLPY